MAAGIGITLFRSIFRQRSSAGKSLNATLLYFNRMRGIPFQTEFEELAKNCLEFEMKLIIVEPVTVEKIFELSPGTHKQLVYISGPAPMVSSLGSTEGSGVRSQTRPFSRLPRSEFLNRIPNTPEGLIMASTAEKELIVYGASWCPDCRRTKEFLGNNRIAYQWIDLEANPEKTVEVENLNGGKRIIPTIIFPDGSFLAEPSNDELAERLNLSRSAQANEYDVVIVGGGPTGLTTSIYAARENSKVLIIEKSVPGGQAGITERLDNYPGFPDGVGGADLADRITRQAKRYGVEILQAVSVTSVRPDGNRVFVETSAGASVEAKAVLIATGSTYRRTGAEGEQDLIGAGIHFCATCDGPFYNGASNLVVVGGGNSGLEEGLFLTQFAERVTIIQSGQTLSASKLLQDKVLAHPKMRVLTNTQLMKFNADKAGKIESISVRDRTTEVESTLSTSAAFIFVGLDPNTGFLADQIAVDDRGFILTDKTFLTNLPGVFAAGDVRGGSTKQLASAVGEGAAAAIQIRYYLDALSVHP